MAKGKRNLLDAWGVGELEKETAEDRAEDHRTPSSAMKVGRPSYAGKKATSTIIFFDENQEYCKLRAKENRSIGGGYSGFINELIEKDKAEHEATAEKARKLFVLKNE